MEMYMKRKKEFLTEVDEQADAFQDAQRKLRL